MPFKIIRNDITKVEADAIVNTANPYVGFGSGVDERIYNVAGKEKLLEARSKIGYLKAGEVAITDGFNLKCDYIIHVSCPIWKDGNYDEIDTLKRCYEEALDLACKNGCKSIAFPLLSTGNYGFPKEVGLDVAISCFTSFLENHEIEIILVVYDSKTTLLSKSLFKEIDEFIGDDEIEEATCLNDFNESDLCAFKSEERYRNIKTESYHDNEIDLSNESSLEDILKDVYKQSFGKYLQQLINKKGLKNSSVYAKANISKQYFSKLLNDQIKPSKEKMLALAVGLELNLDETVDFLKFAGYALSPISQTDKVVEFFIEHRQYNVIKIDMALFDYGLDPLSK